jgi:mono/diheme cytochrome c family protein
MIENSFLPSLQRLAVLCILPAALTTVAADENKPAAAAATETTAELVMSEEAIAEGHGIFVNTCGFCHSQGGRKQGKGPKLANSERSNEFMFNRIHDGKTGSMAAFGHVFTDQQIWAIIAYIRSLDEEGK